MNTELVGASGESAVTTLAVHLKVRRDAVPGRSLRGRIGRPRLNLELGSLVEVDDFQARVRDRLASTRCDVPDAELVLRLRRDFDADGELPRLAVDPTLDPERVPQVRVAALVEGSSESDSRLDREDRS